jgi:uncharacterized protein (TIGR00730 family)
MIHSTVHQSICVFCGSSSGANAAYRGAAAELGGLLAAQGRRLVYGGGNVGLMGVVADAVLESGGTVIGVIPQHLLDLEVGHHQLTELRVVHSMHERKQQMSELADAFVLLPGGLGSLEEFFEIWTWGQLGLHQKPYGILNVAGYFDALLAFLDHAAEERFLHPEHRRLVSVADDAADLLGKLDRAQAPVLPKWVDRSTT